MMYTKEVVATMSLEDIEKAIAGLEDLLKKMVGTLYPIIVRQELYVLKLRRWELQGSVCS